MSPMTPYERAALDRLIAHAMRDSGQSRKCADFLLAWWNPDRCGRFDFRVMWSCDDEIVADMVTVFALIGRSNAYPDALGYKEQFETLVRDWRPDLQP